MSDDLTNILSNSNKDIDNQKLMDYLSQQLAKEETHAIEKMMTDDPFIDDAVEGLGYFTNQKNIPDITAHLNQQLNKHLQQKKLRKQKRKWKDNPMVYLIIAAILILIVVSYIVIKKQLNP